MKFQITHRFSGAVIFELGCGSMKLCIEAAVKSGADLSGANLSGADLSGANLSGADLSRANLSGANLWGVDLSYANLSRANLSCANLSYANLSRANLSGADLSRANLSRANPAIHLGYPNGWSAFAWVKENQVRVQVGCKDFTLAEGRDYWKCKENRREVLAALDYAETIANIRGWIK